MDLFARVNAVYATFFGSSPPARACIAVDLPDVFRVQIEAVAYAEKSPSERQALHVQGLSYWAPANIGPYSQAVTVRSFICSYHIPSSCIPPDQGPADLHLGADRAHTQYTDATVPTVPRTRDRTILSAHEPDRPGTPEQLWWRVGRACPARHLLDAQAQRI